MTTNRKTTWTLVDGVYRAECNNRRIWVWRSEPGSWMYGTAGIAPISETQGWNPGFVESVNRGALDIQCVWGAPRKHLAMNDAILLASNLLPADRPTRRMYGGVMRRVWDINPAYVVARNTRKESN